MSRLAVCIIRIIKDVCHTAHVVSVWVPRWSYVVEECSRPIINRINYIVELQQHK